MNHIRLCLTLALLIPLLTACTAGLTPNPTEKPIFGSLDIGSYPNGWSDYRIMVQHYGLPELAPSAQQPSLGSFVLMLASDGQVLAKSTVDIDGNFGFSALFNRTAALVLASQDDAGRFICRSTLEYHDYDEQGIVIAVNPVILAPDILSERRTDLGRFSFTGDTANPAADASNKPASARTLAEAPEFADGSYLDCDNTPISRPHIRGRFVWELPARLDSQALFDRAIVIAAEFNATDSTLAPLAFAPVESTGDFDLTLTKTPDTTLEVLVFLADQSFLESSQAAELQVPLVYLNHYLGLEHIFLDNDDVDFAEIAISMAYLSGQVRNTEEQPIDQAYVFAVNNRGKLSLVAETYSNETGFYELLIPVDDVSYLLAGQADIEGQSFVGTISNNYVVNAVAELQEDLTLLKLPR